MRKFVTLYDSEIDEECLSDYIKDGKELTLEEKRNLLCEFSIINYEEALYMFDIQLSDEIIVLGSIGRWDGRRNGYKIIESGNIKDCLKNTGCDEYELYSDGYNLRFRGVHHDGSNEYLYRTWKPELSIEQKDNFLIKIEEGKLTKKDITRYTQSLLPFIKELL